MVDSNLCMGVKTFCDSNKQIVQGVLRTEVPPSVSNRPQAQWSSLCTPSRFGPPFPSSVDEECFVPGTRGDRRTLVLCLSSTLPPSRRSLVLLLLPCLGEFPKGTSTDSERQTTDPTTVTGEAPSPSSYPPSVHIGVEVRGAAEGCRLVSRRGQNRINRRGYGGRSEWPFENSCLLETWTSRVVSGTCTVTMGQGSGTLDG